MSEASANKAALRRTLLANRQAIPAEVRRHWDKQIAARLLAWWQACPVPTVGVYWPIRGEPDLRPAYAELALRQVRLALPVVTGKAMPLRFIEWKPGDATATDAFGVAVPVSGAEITPAALLIPCVGFNNRNYRLGYGGGFYDRTLAMSLRPRTVGVSYACGLAAFDTDEHDIALDTVLTEQTSINAR
jgi:5,10-methenyltetrahydrofolate synthetase